MKQLKKPNELPLFLNEIRRDLILQIGKKGISLQNIADIFSFGISKGRVHQIVKENDKTNLQSRSN